MGDRRNILVCSIIFFFVIFLFFLVMSQCSMAATVYVDDDAVPGWYDATHVATLLESVDNSSDGDTIFVYDGVYDTTVGGDFNGLDINKNLTITGESKTGVQITSTAAVRDTCFNLISPDHPVEGILNININNVTFYSGDTNWETIYIYAPGYVTIDNVIFSDVLRAIKGGASFSNLTKVVKNCYFYNVEYGLNIDGSGVYVDNCTFTDPVVDKIAIWYDSLYDTAVGSVTNCSFTGYSTCIDFDNHGAHNIDIENNSFENNDIVYLGYDSNYYINFTDNFIANISNYGLRILGNNCTVKDNYFDNVTNHGVYLDNAVDCLVYNNYFDCGINIYNDSGTRSRFNVSKTLGSNIINGPYLGGNYFVNYSGSDVNGDGLGETPYSIGGGGFDYHPLVYVSFPPVFSDPDPANESTGVNPSQTTWNITIEDPDGDLFDYTITCSNGDSTSGVGASNGTFSLTFSSNLEDSTTYTMWVNATDPLGSNTYTRESFLFTTGSAGSVTADFIYSPGLPGIGEDICFRDQSTVTNDIIISWSWRFGDGDTGIGKNIDHSYDEAETYRVTLSVTTSGGRSDNVSKNVVVGFGFDIPRLIPVMPPLYPNNPYTVPEMYNLLRADDESLFSNNKIKIVFLDTGYTSRSYNGVDLSCITGYKDNSFDSVLDDHGHGCIDGDSFIITNDGLMKIKKYYEDIDIIPVETKAGLTKYVRSETMSLSEKGDYIKDEIIATHKVYVKNAVEITTIWSKKLVLTPWHKTPTITENGIVWKRADEITHNDYIAAPIKPSDSGKYQYVETTLSSLPGGIYGQDEKYVKHIKIDEDVAWLIGYVLGDGIITKKGDRVSIFDEKKELLEHAEDIVFEMGFSTGRGIIKDPRENCYILDVYSGCHSFFKSLGIYTKTRNIPDVIYKSPYSVRSAFIAGLFDAEGYVWEPNPNVKNKDIGKIRVVVGTDEDLHKGCVVILDSIGIPSSYKRILKSGYSNNPNNNALYTTVVNQKWNLENFYERVCPYVQSFKKDIVKIKIDKNKINKSNVVFYGDFVGLRVKKINNMEINNYFYDFTTEKNNNYYASGFMVHNTWVSYALGYITQTQIPNAEIISYKVFNSRGESSFEILQSAFDFVERLNPDIVSFSGGAYGNPDDPLSKGIDRLRSKGIVVVVAGGNLGPASSSILSPACSHGAVAIGATDPMRTILDRLDDVVTVWSSRGPVLGVFPKPDLVAPGESIIGPWKTSNRVVSGTSMSTPFVAGGFAVVYANNKPLLDIVELLYFWDKGIVPGILEGGVASTVFVKEPVDSYGLGIPDFKNANHAVFVSAILHILLWFIVLIVVVVVIVYLVRRSRSKNTTSQLSKKG